MENLTKTPVRKCRTSANATRGLDTAIRFNDNKIDRYESFTFEGTPCIRIYPKLGTMPYVIEFTGDGVKGLEAAQEYLIIA